MLENEIDNLGVRLQSNNKNLISNDLGIKNKINSLLELKKSINILDVESFREYFIYYIIGLAKNSSDFANVLLTLIETGKIEEELLNRKFIDSFELAKSSNDFIYLFINLIETGKIEEELLNKISIDVFELAKSNNYFRDILLVLIETGNIEEELLNKIVIDSFELAKNNYDFVYLFIKLIETGKIEEELLNKVLIDSFELAKSNNNFVEVLLMLIETGKIEEELLNRKFIDSFELAKSSNDFIYLFINLIETGKIEEELLNKISIDVFELAKSNNNFVEVLLMLIETGKIEKELLNRKFIDSFELAYYNYYPRGKIFLSTLFNNLLLDNEKNYDLLFAKNIEISNKILNKFDTKNLSLLSYIEKNFFDLHKLDTFANFCDRFIDYNIKNLDFLFENLFEIVELSEKTSFELAYFIVAALKGYINDKSVINENFPVNKSNFISFLSEDEPLFEFEKDFGIEFELKPWTKKWFELNPERKDYLDINIINTFKKFGSIVAIGITESFKSASSTVDFYENMFKQISYSENRKAILQLGEVFNLIIKNNNYNILSEIVGNNIGKEFEDFVNKYSLKDKGRTILTLMIVREIKDSFQIYNTQNGDEKVIHSSIQTMLTNVLEKLNKYKKVIDKYDNFPIKTSIGIEYKVTTSIAKGYSESIGGSYKNDIETLSDYSGISKGNDAVHEIATNPTDNPYLLLLELNLLGELGFIDLNFVNENYSNGVRGLHITLGGEYGLEVDNNINFVQNVLIASNLGGINAGKKIEAVNYYSNIRNKSRNFEELFYTTNESAIEYRSLSLDKKEQFERLLISIFNLNAGVQSLSVLKDQQIHENNLVNFEVFNQYINNNSLLNTKVEDERILKLAYNFLLFKKDVFSFIDDHNKNFELNESLSFIKSKELDELLLIFTSTSPFVGIMNLAGIDIGYLKKLSKKSINSQEEFEKVLEKDGKDILNLTQRQKDILYKGFVLKVKKLLEKLDLESKDIYNNLDYYLNSNVSETLRKITNKKRFIEVISSENIDYNTYMNNLKFYIKDFLQTVTPDLINRFTSLNNLFIKRDSTNALSMFDTTIEGSDNNISDRRYSETTIFDKVEMGLKARNGNYYIQGTSPQMLINAIQKRILDFNKIVEKII